MTMRMSLASGNDDCPRSDHYLDNEGFVPIHDSLGHNAWEKIVQQRVDDQGDNDDNREHLEEWIRLENFALDDGIDGVTSCDDVFQQIRAARLEQSRLGGRSADLYPRTWRATTTTKGSTDDTTAVADIRNNDDDDPADVATFSVAQFNTLAEGLSSGPDAPKPFPNANPNSKNDNNDNNNNAEEYYGGFTSLDHPEAILDFSKRRWRLLEAILGNSDGDQHDDSDDASSLFDLIGLQEVDRYHGFFAPVLRLFGYQGIFMPKKKSPCVSNGWYSDGCCLFWKTEKFDLVSQRRLDYKIGGNQLAILATLRHRASGKRVVVAVTHLKAQRIEINERMRKQQVRQLLKALEDEAGKVAAVTGASGIDETSQENVPILILGDFNADPPSQLGFAGAESSSVGLVLKHGRDAAAAAAGGGGGGGDKCESSTSDQLNKKQNHKYQSVYEIDNPSADFWTTWKVRGETSIQRIIDYIFFAGVIRCTASLDVPRADMMELSRLPGLRYPSDHLLIAGKFRFK